MSDERTKFDPAVFEPWVDGDGTVRIGRPNPPTKESLKARVLASLKEHLEHRREGRTAAGLDVVLRAWKGHAYEAEVRALMTPEERQEFGLE
jgi:hypothetical protein